jgi:hypothetical protein
MLLHDSLLLLAAQLSQSVIVPAAIAVVLRLRLTQDVADPQHHHRLITRQ